MPGDFTHNFYNRKLKEKARSLRNDATKAEIRLWSELLRGRNMCGYQFFRQRPVLNYIADFFCKELKLIIEVDGSTHDSEPQWEKDKERQKKLEEAGFSVLRFTDEEVMKDLRNVERVVMEWIEERT